MTPTYQSGFYAPGRGTAKYPELWRGCVGAWSPSLGQSGLVLRDWSGFGNNGVLTNGPTWGVTGGRQALSFNGTSHVEGSIVSSVPGSTSLTLSLRFKRSAISAKAGFFGYGDPLSTVARVCIQVWSDGQIYFTLGNGIYGYFGSNDTEWHALTGRFSGGGSTNAERCEIWLDGVKRSLTFAGTIPTTIPAVTVMRMGLTFPTTSGYCLGSVSDLMLHQRLSQRDIVMLATRPGIAYELAPRKVYSIPAAASTRQYKLLRPSILRGA